MQDMNSYLSRNLGQSLSIWVMTFALLLAMQPQIAQAFDGQINIRNNTGYDIYSAFVSPDGSNGWGEDVLGNGVLEDGEQFSVELNGYDSSVFDVKLVDEDGDVYLFENVDVLFEDIVANIDHLEPGLNESISTGSFEGYIDVTNDTGYDIYYLYVSHEDSSSWGEDVLGSEILPSGESFWVDLDNYPSSIFNVRAQDLDGDTYTVNSIDAATQDLTLTLGHLDGATGGNFSGYIDVTNDTGYDIYYLYVSHEDSSSWGEDVLGSEILPSGESFWVDLDNYPSSIFNVRAQDVDGDTYTVNSIDAATQDLTLTLAHLGDGADGDFSGYIDVTNSTGYDIYYLYVSHEDSSGWGEDVLGSEILRSGDSFWVDLDNYPSSIFDVKAEDEDGDTYTIFGIDASIDDLTLTLSDLD